MIAEAARRSEWRRGRRKSRSCRSKWSFCLASLGHAVAVGRSVGQSCLEQAHDSRRVAKPDRGSRKTLDRAGAGAGFSGNPSKPVFPSAGLSSSPPSLLANPFFLPFRPPSAFTFFPLIHQRMTLNRPLPPSIHPRSVLRRKEGSKAASAALSVVVRPSACFQMPLAKVGLDHDGNGHLGGGSRTASETVSQ